MNRVRRVWNDEFAAVALAVFCVAFAVGAVLFAGTPVDPEPAPPPTTLDESKLQ